MLNNNLNTGLTQREKEVLELLKKGLSNSEISERLFVSNSTVKAHISSILQKLKVKNRYAAALKMLNTYNENQSN